MNKVKAVIIEDEQKSRELLAHLMETYCPEIKICGSFDSVQASLSTIKKEMPGLVFLDIELPNENGFMLFKYFVKPSFRVVFTTAYNNFAIKALRLSALDYLLKPIDPTELQLAVKKFLENQDASLQVPLYQTFYNEGNNKLSKVAIPTSDGYLILNTEDIVLLEADGNYTKIHMVDKKKHTASKTLGSFGDLLSQDLFFRVNRSAVVNINFIDSYSKKDDHSLFLKDGTRIPVVDRKREEFLKYFKKG